MPLRILVATLPERGHYHPLLGPAAELARRGHAVWFAAPADITDELAAVGVARDRICIPPDAPPPSTALRGAALAAILRDAARLAAWIRALLVDAPRAGIEPLRAILRAVRPDVVAIDTMAYDAAIAASLEGIPWVGWATSLNPIVDSTFDSTLLRTLHALDADRRALFAAHGMAHARFRVSDVLSPDGTACFATAALVGAGAGDPTVALVGPSCVAGPPRGGALPDLTFADDRPLVYASFGSQAWHQPARFARLAEACARLGFALVAATGELALPAAEHVRAVPFADQRALLPRVSALVTHGGANSIMEACAAGTPMLVAPICNDQPHGAAIVARAGNGLALDLDTASPDALDDALVRLVTDRALRARADAIRADYASHDGSRGAADLTERAARLA